MTTNLPEQVGWWINSETLDFYFRVRPGDLEIVDKVTMFGDCDQFRLVGSYDYANGGGAYAVLIVQTDGCVYGIDLERSPECFLFNSTYEAFASTFDVLDEFLSVGAMLPKAIRGEIAKIDPLAFESSEWRALIEYLLDE